MIGTGVKKDDFTSLLRQKKIDFHVQGTNENRMLVSPFYSVICKYVKYPYHTINYTGRQKKDLFRLRGKLI